MNKSVITFCTIIFSLAGGYIPMLLGVSILGGWSILGSFIGGIFGIWFGVIVSKRFF